MKYLIGKSETVQGFNIVGEVSEVTEEKFNTELEKVCRTFGESDELTKIAMDQADKYLKTGQSVTIDGNYFVISNRAFKKKTIQKSKKQS